MKRIVLRDEEYDILQRALTNPDENASKDKYPVNVIFDGDLETDIKARAKELGLGVATYIKMLVKQDLNRG